MPSHSSPVSLPTRQHSGRQLLCAGNRAAHKSTFSGAPSLTKIKEGIAESDGKIQIGALRRTRLPEYRGAGLQHVGSQLQNLGRRMRQRFSARRRPSITEVGFESAFEKWPVKADLS